MIKDFKVNEKLIFAVLVERNFRRLIELPLTNEAVTLESLEAFCSEASEIVKELNGDEGVIGVGFFMGGRVTAGRVSLDKAASLLLPFNKFETLDLEVLLAFVERVRRIMALSGSGPDVCFSDVKVLKSYLGLLDVKPEVEYSVVEAFEENDVSITGSVIASYKYGRIIFN